MSQAVFLQTLNEVLWLIMVLGTPVLLTTLVIGVAISIFQAITQIQESTLTFVPKIVVALGVLAFTGPWMVGLLMDYTTRILSNLNVMVQ